MWNCLNVELSECGMRNDECGITRVGNADCGMLNDGRNKENRPKDNIKALQERMKRFGLAVIHMTEKLPSTRAANVMSTQIIRSGASPGAN